MDYTTQRGILQLIIGVCCALFALSMAVRTWRQDGLRWPLPWRALVTLWIASLSWSYLTHGVEWITPGDARFDVWRTVAPLYAVCGMSLWTFYRWAREERLESM